MKGTIMSQARHIGKALKGAGKAIGRGMEALAEAQRLADERIAEEARIEADERAAVDKQIEHYEQTVGKPFVMPGSKETKIGDRLPWDAQHKGHLINCREHCMTDHCLECGAENFGRVYCVKHR